ncbi:UNVERIFIED_CONTAM: hypothetical protein NCL1_22534 [Trichonephila clavipes]
MYMMGTLLCFSQNEDLKILMMCVSGGDIHCKRFEYCFVQGQLEKNHRKPVMKIKNFMSDDWGRGGSTVSRLTDPMTGFH